MQAEQTLLVDCLRFMLDPDRYAIPILSARENWDQLLRLAVKNRAAGALIFLEKTIPGFWPREFAGQLSSYRYSMLIHGESAVQRVRALLEALQTAGIAVIVMKGWEVIHTVYNGDYSLRPCGDVDLLIHPEHLRWAEAVLAQAGFQPLIELWPGFRYRYHNTAYHYLLDSAASPGFQFGADLHWGLINLQYHDRRISIAEIFQRAVPLDAAGGSTGGALRLSVEDHILHACAHHSLHHGTTGELYHCFELAWTILRANSGVDWQALFERAAAWKLQMPLQEVLAETERLFPGTLPAAAAARLQSLPIPKDEQRTYRLQRKYRDTPLIRLLPMRWAPAYLWTSLCYLFEAFVPGPQFLAYRYGQTRFWPLLYARRAGNALKQLLAFARRP